MKKVKIFTDGACSGNPGVGGWAYMLLYKGYKKSNSGCEKETTNNRMELTAIINALKALKEPCEVELYTDSKYCYEGFTKWLSGWIEKGWRKSDKKDVKNRDLWEEIYKLSKAHKINMIWINAFHNAEENSLPQNDIVDKMAKGAIKNCL